MRILFECDPGSAGAAIADRIEKLIAAHIECDSKLHFIRVRRTGPQFFSKFGIGELYEPASRRDNTDRVDAEMHEQESVTSGVDPAPLVVVK